MSMKNPQLHRVMVTGGAGYVGAMLVPALLDAGYAVNVLDLYIYGEDVLAHVRGNPRLAEIKGDIRDPAAVARALQGCDAVIHLACISNDPSFELNPALGRSINLDAFVPLVRASKDAGVKRFIYASSSSVYGVKEGVEVTEELSREPLTDYSRFKAECEDLLDKEHERGFVVVTVRPATVCGYSPRQRLDVVVNILTNLGYNRGEISVFGGDQLRPNIHIGDMVDVYLLLLAAPADKIDGKVFNAGYENHTVMQLAKMVQSQVGNHVKLVVKPTNDPRSYHVSSRKIQQELGFAPHHAIDQAVGDLITAFNRGKLPNSLDDPRYFNIKMMQRLNLH
jgi:nucleoside-diphosphate-sugar epimerase